MQMFYGRSNELSEWRSCLVNSAPHSILIVGPAGIGKSYLMREMADQACGNHELQCASIRYEVTPDQTPDQIFDLLIVDAINAAQLHAGIATWTPRSVDQFRALFQTILPRGSDILSLFDTLRPLQKISPRDALIDALHGLSNLMPENARAIICIDVRRYLNVNSEEAWTILAERLPEKVKLLVTQAPDDKLASSPDFNRLGTTTWIPRSGLGELDEPARNSLIEHALPSISAPEASVFHALHGYGGHPYALTAALDLLAAGTPLESLPHDPTPRKIAERQWSMLSERHGEKGIAFFMAIAFLESLGEPVPMAWVLKVSNLSSAQTISLTSDRFIDSLVIRSGSDISIYHQVFRNEVTAQAPREVRSAHHKTIADLYTNVLETADDQGTSADYRAIMGITPHTFEAHGGDSAFCIFITHAWNHLIRLGLYRTAEDTANWFLTEIPNGTEWHAILLNHLGVLYKYQGELDRARSNFSEALTIFTRLDIASGIADCYGNIGLIDFDLDNLDAALAMQRNALKFHQTANSDVGIANTKNNIGTIYRKHGRLREAAILHGEAAQLFQKSRDHKGEADAYGNLANVFMQSKNHEKAVEMILNALSIYQNIENRSGIAQSFGVLGLLYRETGKHQEAKDAIESELEEFKKLGHKRDIAAAYANLGRIYADMNDRQSALYNWSEAKRIFSSIGHDNECARINRWIDELPTQ